LKVLRTRARRYGVVLFFISGILARRRLHHGHETWDFPLAGRLNQRSFDVAGVLLVIMLGRCAGTAKVAQKLLNDHAAVEFN